MITTTFGFTGATQTWTVPVGITKITAEAWGAAGFDSNTSGDAGRGGYVKAEIGVASGEVLTIYVGGRGTSTVGGFGHEPGGNAGSYTAVSSPSLMRGGGGGGSSSLNRSSTPLIIAGGGGGAGGGSSSFPSKGLGGAGGNPGTAGAAGTSPNGAVGGGGGGGATIGAGGAGGALSGGTGAAGGAGTASIGGNGGHYTNAGSNFFPGGGGGGGHFGGGGGGGGGVINTATNQYPAGGGGGGGSSMANGGTPIQFLTGVRNGNGRVTISYVESPPSVPTDVTPSAGSVLNVDDPTLTARFTVNTLSQAAAKVEWSLATDAAFTQNVRTYIQPDSARQSSPTSIATYKVGSSQADQRLHQATWFIRARTIDANGTTSAFSSVQSFRVEHPPTTLNHYPTGNTAIQHVSTGVTLAWDFISASSGVNQIAYQVNVEQNNGTTVVDTGLTTSVDQQAVVQIPLALKGTQLRWRVRVWDSDGVMGPYSDYHLFRTADLPTVVITAMDVIGTANPLVSFDATPAGSAPITQSRLFITRDSDGAIVYDSGWK